MVTEKYNRVDNFLTLIFERNMIIIDEFLLF